MKTQILFTILAASLPLAAKTAPPPVDAPADKVQIALLLDTSNSMDGLIDQAKTQLWKVVNTFTDARRDGRTPYVEVALYEYGNNHLHIGDHWIRQVEPFTRDLDEVSRELFAFRTFGGDEYCGAVIQRALADLAWDHSPKTYKAVFIAGNEAFTQGPVNALQACRDAMAKGIVVNTIHCGNHEAGVAGSWNDGAALAGGKYLIINQDKAVVHIDAPQDQDIARLGIELNKTYLGYGKHWKAAVEKQGMADRDAEKHAASGAFLQRSLTKASANYSNAGWDLIDAIKEGTLEIAKVPEEDLPGEMKPMSLAEREAHIAKLARERGELQSKIHELHRQREAYVAEASKKPVAGDGEKTLDQAIIEAVKGQAQACGYVFAK